jgi:tRNA 2-selenouridine synthase
LYTLDIPFEARLAFIVKQYGSFEKEKLVNAIIRIQKRLGGLDAKTAINHLLENNVSDCFRILLSYYDKQYIQSMEKANRPARVISANTVDESNNATILLNALNNAQ